MDVSSTDTLLSSKHSSRCQGPYCDTVPALRPALIRAPPSRPWHTGSDSDDSSLYMVAVEANCPRIKFARNHSQESGVSGRPLYSDPTKVYPSPPSGSSTSKKTIPLPEEVGEFESVYSTHLAGVLDSPPVVRRQDLASQKPLTPPPTIPHSTLSLPDADIDMPFVDEQLEEDEAEFEDDQSYFSSSDSSSPPFTLSDHPFLPLSPNWDSSCAPTLSMTSPQDLSDLEQSDTLFSPCRHTPPSHQSSSLLEVDPPCPSFIPIGFPWSPSPYGDAEDSTPLANSFPSSSSLTDYDELLPPSSPLISGLDLPDIEDEAIPKIIPSSPSRRSCRRLPDIDIVMGGFTNDPALTPSGQHLLSLPGAEIDNDLIPTLPASAPFVPSIPNRPLLLIDDPRDVPLPRSPSPEDFDFCISTEDIADPELTQLVELRKRSITAERPSKHAETFTDESDLLRRAETRKPRKRGALSKEVGALIRLKLGDRIPTCPHVQSPERDQQNYPRSRGVIGNISQLVAQMVFRRRETSRPFSKRRPVVASREYPRSPLSHVFVSSDSE